MPHLMIAPKFLALCITSETLVLSHSAVTGSSPLLQTLRRKEMLLINWVEVIILSACYSGYVKHPCYRHGVVCLWLFLRKPNSYSWHVIWNWQNSGRANDISQEEFITSLNSRHPIAEITGATVDEEWVGGVLRVVYRERRCSLVVCAIALETFPACIGDQTKWS